MDMQAMMDAFGAKISQEAGRDVMTLGELIARLEALPQDAETRLDFYSLPPAGFCSYRGYYEMLAIKSGVRARTVAQVLADARAAMGAKFEGYKGGQYRMTRSTPIWVSNYGDASDQALQSIEMRDGVAVFVSEERE